MKRADAQKAVDDAFADGIKHLFGVLVQNVIIGNAGAGKTFEAGIAKHDEAHSIASAAIETIFPD